MAGGEEAAPRKSCCNASMFFQILLFAIWSALGVALIVVGAKYQNQCPAEPFIPIYMIVAGAFSFAYLALLPLECCFPTVRRILSILVSLFVFAWFIAGSVWVFRIYNNNPRECHNGMYLLVFSILIIQYIFMALGVIGAFLACICCENSCVTKICSYFQSCLECCPCLQCLKCFQCNNCLESCPCLKCCKCSCLQNCSCLESCCCLDSCSCLESCCSLDSCLDCLKCSNCCKCLQGCDCCRSLCCCCKSIQCSSCLKCNMCAQLCGCCAAKV